MSRLRLLAVVAVVAVMAAVAIPANGSGGTRTYEVTITNLTDGQPLSPPVAVTHRGAPLFKVGRFATPAIEAIAEDGNQALAVNGFTGALDVFTFVSDVVDGGEPLTPAGTVAAGFDDTLTFNITADRRDRFSLATMLICTNDGFTGADRVKLPNHGTRTYHLRAYDAGTENNTEMSEDIVDPCSGLGPVALAGDPNGNENDAVATSPVRRIRRHQGVDGTVGDLLGVHDWGNEPIAVLTITRTDGGGGGDDDDDD